MATAPYSPPFKGTRIQWYYSTGTDKKTKGKSPPGMWHPLPHNRLSEALDQVQSKLDKIKGASVAGMQEAIRLVYRSMNNVRPLLPIGKSGRLKGSWVVKQISDNPITFEFGFEAPYSVHVERGHPVRFRRKRKYRRQGAGAFFFSKALHRERNKMVRIIRNRVRQGWE